MCRPSDFPPHDQHSSWTDGTGITTVKDRSGRVISITGPDGRPARRNKYGETVETTDQKRR